MVRELRSHKLCGVVKKNLKRRLLKMPPDFFFLFIGKCEKKEINQIKN